MPRRRPRRMRQRYQVKLLPRARYLHFFRPMIPSAFCNGINCSIASLPTGMTSAGLRISNSPSSQPAQFFHFLGRWQRGRRRSPSFPENNGTPPPCKSSTETRPSSIPAASWNQRNSVFSRRPRRKAAPATGSLSPGACPTSMTRLTTAPPLTTGLPICGQRPHSRSRFTCRASNRVVRSSFRFAIII